jgi:hypothetical protein
MIKKVVKIKNLNDKYDHLDDLTYWLNKSAGERVAAVEYLRRQFHGGAARLQRVARVVQQA